MPYEESIAERIRLRLTGDPRFTEKRMFGGVAFLLYGNMSIGVFTDQLIVRVGVPEWTKQLGQPHVGEFDLTGRSMKGWLMIRADGFDTDDQLQMWIDRAIDFTLTLPPK